MRRVAATNDLLRQYIVIPNRLVGKTAGCSAAKCRKIPNERGREQHVHEAYEKVENGNSKIDDASS